MAFCTSNFSNTALCRLDLLFFHFPIVGVDVDAVLRLSLAVDSPPPAALRLGGTMMGIARGGGGHCMYGHEAESIDEIGNRGRVAHPTLGLIEVERSPRGIVLLESHNMVLEIFKSIEESPRGGRYCEQNPSQYDTTL